MGEEAPFPLTIDVFESKAHPLQGCCGDLIYEIIKKAIVPEINGQIPHSLYFNEQQRKRFEASLPFVSMRPLDNSSKLFSFFTIYPCKVKAFKFFFEMITQWLVPRKELHVGMVHATDFKIEQFSNHEFTFCEVVVQVNRQEELDEIRSNWPNLKLEIQLGVQSHYHARQIIEMKGHTTETKNGAIHERIAYLLKRWPDRVDEEIITEMQHFLVTCSESFKQLHSSRHLSRMIMIQYFFRKRLREAIKLQPTRRHFNIKLFKTERKLDKENSTTPALALIIAMNFMGDNEVVEERHLLSAIHDYIPDIIAIPNSFCSSRRGHESVITFYVEIGKKNGVPFTEEEISSLKRGLPLELNGCIEQLVHPIFMPRNEEEVVRNILSLSSQVRYLHDPPQMIISFDLQTVNELFFNVILVRVLKPMQLSCQEMLKQNSGKFEYIHERTRTLGQMRKKYLKEGALFCVKLPKEPYLRKDHSIDLYKARQAVVAELVQIFGDIRDFNGGMLTKQNEKLARLVDLLKEHPKYNQLLLENFFYSLSPDIMRTVLDPHLLKALFHLLQESMEQTSDLKQEHLIKWSNYQNYLLAMVKSENKSVKEALDAAFLRHSFPQDKKVSSMVLINESIYLGYMCLSDDPSLHHSFAQAIRGQLTRT